ncbi:hypothetical protein MIN45_P0824 [Methylomarinovum tepidoasis]|uniref:Cell division coordinator CpoB n=1 Tax=Methylomarinovum tepidoasis TaxID=2840183 RepID=A0AAU9C7Q8_9GAMM|nr:tol-pal system protein YbgF [Methylomarinovum sp. IN45]BCX88455.1 hypothetical protein MIN45_P0824 [Methylomarinovum sp. IN45]
MAVKRVVLALGLAAAFPALAGDEDLERRVRLLEQRLSSQALMDMLQRVDALQREVQALRGQVEALQHEVDRLRQSAPSGTAPAAVTSAPEAPPVPPAAEAASPLAVEDQAQPADPEAIRQAYRQAFDLLQAGHYDAAIDAFSTFLQRHPDSPLAPNAYYWLGEAYYVKRDFRAAADAFGQVVAHFPGSAKVPDALLKLGYIAEARGDRQAARRYLEKVRDTWPTAHAAKLAAERLARMEQARP